MSVRTWTAGLVSGTADGVSGASNVASSSPFGGGGRHDLAPAALFHRVVDWFNRRSFHIGVAATLGHEFRRNTCSYWPTRHRCGSRIPCLLETQIRH